MKKTDTEDTVRGIANGILLIILAGIVLLLVYRGIEKHIHLVQAKAAVSRGTDIVVSIRNANIAREPLGLPPLWPKAGERMDMNAQIDIADMTFENSSDYFTVLLDGENMGTPVWSPYVTGLDWSSFAGGGILPKKGAGRLVAEHNIWTIAANITDDMPDDIPVIVSRNVDPASLIPCNGDISQQHICPSSTFTPQLMYNGFVLIQKGGKAVIGSWEKTELRSLYQSDIQDIQTAFRTVKYLTP